MKGRVVVADIGMNAPDGGGEIIVCPVLKKEPLDIDPHAIVRVGSEQNFPEGRHVLREAGGREHVELAKFKSVGRSVKMSDLISGVTEEIQLESIGNNVGRRSLD